jgi:hypothetical protein
MAVLGFYNRFEQGEPRSRTVGLAGRDRALPVIQVCTVLPNPRFNSY